MIKKNNGVIYTIYLVVFFCGLYYYITTTYLLKNSDLLTSKIMIKYSSRGISSKKQSKNKLTVRKKGININSSNVEELVKLPGIGPVLANRIVLFRKKNGFFKNIEDLMNVKGIGKIKFRRIKDKIVIDSN